MKIIRKLKYPLTIILFMLIIVYIAYTKNKLNKSKFENIVIENEFIEEKIQDEIITKYNIDIKGAIKNPGVYQVDNNLTVNEVIKIAGGLTKDADTSVINLAKKIKDEMVIIVYTKEEVKNSNIVDTVIKVVEKECICPNIENDGCLNTEIKDSISNGENNNLVNINTASKEELQTIKGIGESKADSIIKYREKNGLFKTIEDIKNVEGIGDTLYETIKVYITT
jgi:competence protein ComEA